MSNDATPVQIGTKERARGNPFGLGAALGGFAAGVIFGSIAYSLFANASGHPKHPSTFGSDIANLVGLWVGLVGAALVVSRSHGPSRSVRTRLVEDFGMRFRPWPDLGIGIVIGLAAQYLLVPLLELPLVPFVPHLFHRLGDPARSLTNNVSTEGLVVLGILVCLGSPLVEELFFRGLLLRGLLGRFAGLGRFAPVLSVAISALAFGLAHFEALQLLGLIGFGAVLGALAYRSGRLGPGIVAHMAFNATTFVAIAFSH